MISPRIHVNLLKYQSADRDEKSSTVDKYFLFVNFVSTQFLLWRDIDFSYIFYEKVVSQSG